MRQKSLHRGLESRLKALGNRIEALRQATERTTGAERLERFGEIEELSKRHRALTEQLEALNQAGPGFRQNLKADWETIADDLSGIIDDFTMRLDAENLGAKRTLLVRKW